MRPFVRLAVLALVASHLATVSAPCPTAPSPGREPAADAVHAAATAAPDVGPAPHRHEGGPCLGHAQRPASSDPESTTWWKDRCPCGCGTAVPPGSATARTGPALLLATTAPLHAPDRVEIAAPGLRPTRIAPAPPDHVPLAV